jgi:hypothetical protein
MNNLITSMYVQTLYMLGMGLGFLLIPNFILPLFGFSPTNEVWIRVLGALAAGFAGYYYTMIQQKNLTYFWATVWGRYWFCGCLAVLAFLQIGSAALYLFALLETGFAVWTHFALLQVGKKV